MRDEGKKGKSEKKKAIMTSRLNECFVRNFTNFHEGYMHIRFSIS